MRKYLNQIIYFPHCLLLTLVLLLNSNESFAQKKLDSLDEIINSSLSDTTIILTLLQKAEILEMSDFKASKEVNLLALQKSKNIDYHLGVYKSYYGLASLYYETHLTDSMIYYLDTLQSLKSDNLDNELIADTYNLLGIVNYDKKNLIEAIEAWTKALEYYPKSKSAGVISNIGNIYLSSDEKEKALDYFLDAVEINLKLENYTYLAINFFNISLCYDLRDTLNLHYLKESEKYFRKVNYIRALPNVYGNYVYYYSNSYDFINAKRSLDSLEKFSKIQEEEAIMSYFYYPNLNIYRYYLANYKSDGNENLAPEVYESNRSSEALYLEVLDFINKYPANASDYTFQKIQNYRKAFISMKLKDYKTSALSFLNSIRYNDSLELDQAQFILKEYEREQEASAKRELKLLEEHKQKEQMLKDEQQAQKIIFSYLGLGFTLLFAGFIFNRYRVTIRQKNLIGEQKQIVDKAYFDLEIKNTEIMDSISYAKRIQTAILPSEKIIEENFNEAFVIYKPKDIVAGDFYWMEVLKIDNKKKILFASADCTGHGVPGAIISVVCNNGLNRAVREYKLDNPGKILDKTKEIVVSEFEKSAEEVKDGMDIALCSLVDNKLQYAGAHNPLWIIRKDSKEIFEIKANKQPIGKFDRNEQYKNHEIELNQGDTIYIFSDGYVDQFGGPKGKKYMSKNLKNFLLSIQNRSMKEQKKLIEENFEDWKGKQAQLDDVCMIGVRI